MRPITPDQKRKAWKIAAREMRMYTKTVHLMWADGYEIMQHIREVIVPHLRRQAALCGMKKRRSER